MIDINCSSGLQLARVSALSAFTFLVLGCGGGGGGSSSPVANTGTSGGGNPAPTIPSVQPRTFQFPTFSSASKLTVIANYQTTEETPNVTSKLEVQVGDIINALEIPAIVSQRSLSDSGTNRCGYTEVSAITRLFGETPVSQQAVSSSIRPRFQELAAGAREDFFLLPAFKSVTAEKVLEPGETVHCTIFAELIDDQPILSREKALAIAEAFDSNNPQRQGSGIYDQVRAAFGSEWNQNPPGGNDGDQKIVLFFFSSQTLGTSLFGYVSPIDGRVTSSSSSNKGEIIYINGNKSNYQILATLSHEFQHLINQNQKVNQQGSNPSGAVEDNVTVNEGLSGLSEEICGYTLESGNQLLAAVLNDYLEKPEQHEFFDFFESGLGYGEGYLFFKYVREHFGDQTIRNISTDTRTGLNNLNAHLPLGFAETFRRWTIANYATNLTGAVPSIYRYPSGFRTDGTYPAGKLVGINTSPLNNGTTQTGALRPWSASYLTLENKTGTGLSTTVTPAIGSPFGVIFESTSNTFTSFQN